MDAPETARPSMLFQGCATFAAMHRRRVKFPAELADDMGEYQVADSQCPLFLHNLPQHSDIFSHDTIVINVKCKYYHTRNQRGRTIQRIPRKSREEGTKFRTKLTILVHPGIYTFLEPTCSTLVPVCLVHWACALAT